MSSINCVLSKIKEAVYFITKQGKVNAWKNISSCVQALGALPSGERCTSKVNSTVNPSLISINGVYKKIFKS